MIYRKDETVFTEAGVAAIIGGFIVGLLAIKGTFKLLDIRTKKIAEKAIKQAIKKNKDIREFNNKTNIKSTSSDYILDKVEDLDQTEKDNIKFDGYKCFIIEDNRKNIIAYCLYRPGVTHLYLYKILDKDIKDNKDLVNFILASFEFEIGIVGKGITSFTSKVKENDKFTNKKTKDITSKPADPIKVSKEEFDQIIKEIDRIKNELMSFCNTASGYEHPEEYDSTERKSNIYKANYSIFLSLKDAYIDQNELYGEDGEEFNEEYDNEILEYMQKFIDTKLHDKILNSGFEQLEEYSGYQVYVNKKL